MKNLWIDLTDLFEWRGHFTGIQRVTYNYASRSAQEGARFFVYSYVDNRFIEIPFSLVKERSEEVPKWRAVRQRLLSRYKQIPRWLRVVVSPLLRIANRVLRKPAAAILNNQSHSRIIKKLPSASFATNDTVLLLGAGWNSKGIVAGLAKKRKKYNLRVVTHLNDILPIYQPHLFAEELPTIFSKYTNEVLKITDMVTVISEATKKDVLRYGSENGLKIPPIEVVRLGEDIAITTPQKPDKKLADSFVLCVGTFEIRKNYILLYQAVKLAKERGQDLPQIVIAGRKGWLTNDLQYVLQHDSAISDQLILLENMSDANISWLYDHSMFTVFCSLAEGWGLPIAESLQHGKLCLSSNTSSMPEIAGDLIDYFSPFDAKECGDIIAKYTDKHKLNKKTQDIKKKYRVFTWDDSYNQFRTALDKLETA